ncbi:MAG: hypothetical protein ABFD82_03735 [Syntrophaceae bacterium]
MKIVVCIKLIMDPDIVEYDVVSECLNDKSISLCHADSHVLEQGLLMKEKYGGEVVAVSVAPPKGDAILKESLFFGADRAVRIWDSAFHAVDTWQAAQAIAQWLKIERYDLVLCGSHSADLGSSFMAMALGYELDVPCVTNIIGLTMDDDRRIIADKKIEKGKRISYSTMLPAVAGLEDGINESRYVAPFSRTYSKGLKKSVEYCPAEYMRKGRTEPHVTVVRLVSSRPRVKVGLDIAKLSMQQKIKMMRGELGRKKEIFSGSPDESAKKIAERIKEVFR